MSRAARRRALILLVATAATSVAGTAARGEGPPPLFIGIFADVQDYAPSDDLARLPHDGPRVALGPEFGCRLDAFGTLSAHFTIDVNSPLHEDFRMLRVAGNPRIGLRWKTPPCPWPRAANLRLEVAGEHVRTRAAYLGTEYDTHGWAVQVALGAAIPLGRAAVTVAVGHGWEDLGPLTDRESNVARVPVSGEEISMDRQGWFVRVGVVSW